MEPKRLELLTFSVQGSCSPRLSYGPVLFANSNSSIKMINFSLKLNRLEPLDFNNKRLVLYIILYEKNKRQNTVSKKFGL